MMDRLIFTSNGVVKQFIPSEKHFEKQRKEGLTDNQIWNAIKARIQTQENTNDIEQVPESVVPTDRTFRNAWKKKTGGVDVDMARATEIAKDKIREARGPKFDSLDTEYIIADERGDMLKKQEIAQKKQRLRDATDDTRIASAKTPDELKSAMQAIISEL